MDILYAKVVKLEKKKNKDHVYDWNVRDDSIIIVAVLFSGFADMYSRFSR